MIVNPHVPLHRLVLSLSEALDHIHPEVMEHQQRVAYIAVNVARQMGFQGQDLLDVFNAAALHDIGLIGADNRVQALHLGRLERVSSHPEIGFRLLKEIPYFSGAAEFVRYHHTVWDDGRGDECEGRAVPPASHILALADMVERMIDRKVPILEQTEFLTGKVASLSGKVFHPDPVEAFRYLACAEAFWLDTVSKRIYSVLLSQVDWPTFAIDEVALGPISEIFGRIVDASSRWTAVHSAGVAATAVALAERHNFSPRELHLMRGAGYLHDLGKLSVPTRILDKPGRLTKEEMAVVRGHTYHTFRILDTIGGMPQICEWAAFHHERLDGTGYPFRHAGEDLTLGSRIMAVADVFTAVTEERPYRRGMSPEQSLVLLKDLVASGGLDGSVVATLERDLDAVNSLRRQEQIEYGEKQRELAELMERPPSSEACLAGAAAP